MWFSSLIRITVVLCFVSMGFAGVRSFRPSIPGTELSALQEVEVIFQNGLRNAQAQNDVFGQVRELQRARAELAPFERAGTTEKEKKAIAKRFKQIDRMIANESMVPGPVSGREAKKTIQTL